MFAIFPEILQQAEKGDIEAVTCLVRKYFGDQQVFLPNLRVAEVCANAEINIDTNIEKGAARLEAWDAHGQFRIVISIHPDIRSVREQNYILALMLSHVFLDLQPKMAKGELQRTIFEKKTSPIRSLLLQPESASVHDVFASSLLLPKAMVKKALSALSSRKDVAAFFNVELPLLEFRLTILGLFGAEKPAASDPQTTATAPRTTATASRTAATAPRPSATAPRSTAEPQDFAELKKVPSASPRASASSQKKSEINPLQKSKESEKPRPAPSPKSENAPARAAAAEPMEELSSVARVNRSVAARTYKKEGERTDAAPSTSASPGMERLRQLARKIDKSVDE